jgi:hypothetical protein
MVASLVNKIYLKKNSYLFYFLKKLQNIGFKAHPRVSRSY